MQQLQNVIESAFERRADITPANVDTVTREAVNQVIALLDSGALRVAEKIDGQWVTHQWLKKAVHPNAPQTWQPKELRPSKEDSEQTQWYRCNSFR